MTSVLVSEAFAFKDVAQVAAAVSADYLRATPVIVETALHALWTFFSGRLFGSLVNTSPTAACQMWSSS